MNEDLLKKPYWKPLFDLTEYIYIQQWVCSRCGEKTTESVMGKPRYRFCPMCGVRMSNAAGKEEVKNDK